MARMIRSYSEVCAWIPLASSPIATSQTSALCKPIATASSASNCCKCLVSLIMILRRCPPPKRNRNGNCLQLLPRIDPTRSEPNPSKRLRRLPSPRLFLNTSNARGLGVSVEGSLSLTRTPNASINVWKVFVYIFVYIDSHTLKMFMKCMWIM
jgi:hypothetical protein